MRELHITVDAGKLVRVRLHPKLTVLGIDATFDGPVREALGDATRMIEAGDLPSFDTARRSAALSTAEAAQRRADEAHHRLADAAAHAAQRRADAAAEAEASSAGFERARAAATDAERARRDACSACDESAARFAAGEDAALEAREQRARVGAIRTELDELLASCPLPNRPAPDADVIDALVRRAGSSRVGTKLSREATVVWAAAIREGRAALHPSAQALVDRALDIERRRAALPHSPDDDPAVVAAIRRRGELDALIAELRSQVVTGVLSPEARSQIEEAHAHDKPEVLARFGFDSYLEFTIATSTLALGQHARTKLDLAERQHAETVTEIERARAAAIDAATAVAADWDEVRRDVSVLVGHDSDAPVPQELGHILAVPTGVETFAAELAQAERSATERADATERDRTRARDGLDRARADLVVAERVAVHAVSVAAEAAVTLDRARAGLDDAETQAERLAADAEDAAARQHTARAVVDRLLRTRYLDADLAAIRATLATLLDAAAPDGEDTAPVAAMFGALDALDATDAVAVLEDVTRPPRRHRVLYVTADANVLARAKAIDDRRAWCVDLRPGQRSQGGWWRAGMQRARGLLSR